MNKNKNNKTKKYNPKTIRRLLGYAKPYTIWFILAVALIICVVRLELYQPVLIGKTTDYIVNTISSGAVGAGKEIIKIAFQFAGIVLGVFVLNYLQAIILSYVGQKVVYTVRMDVFKHFNKLSINFFNNNPIGKLVTRATNDIETLNEMYTSVIVNVSKSVFILLGVIITMLTYNVKLALLTFTVIPFIVVFTVIFNIYAKKIYGKIRTRISSLNAFLSEHISGMKLVQIFAVEDKMQKKFEYENEELAKDHFKRITMYSVYGPSNFFLKIIAWVLLLYFGGKLFFAGEITIGTIVIFQSYIGKFFDPIEEIADQLNIVQSASAAADKIFNLLDEKIDIVDSENAIELDSIKGEIEFKNVWFAYEGEDWILKDVSFKVEPGQNVAFVGATGAGKTTIQNLITRYYDIQKGEILLDGVNIRDIKVDFLRQQIGQMLQDVFLFTGDVKSNIRLKNENITDEQIFEAAEYVNADKFISKFKHGYDEEVIERGASFSAGQRQLLSFARTLAFKPKVLILDEATANIDTETEELIQDALDKIMTGRTTLVVAHRLSTIQNADRIIVMHKGRIVEQGTHQELLSNHNMYYKLYKLQYEHGQNA
ncbi:MAG: ABC transporter ATP-binding protein [Oscillospiraceae bacterium]